MTNLHVYDNHNHLYLAAMDLPRFSVYQIQSAGESAANGKLQVQPLDLEVGIARILAALAKGSVERMLEVPTGHLTRPIGLETWILRPSPDGRLSEYFAGLRSNTRRRVFIHRTPVRSPLTQARCHWDAAYELLESDRGSKLARAEGSPAALRQGVDVLSHALVAYRDGPIATRRYFENLGHSVKHETDEPSP